MLGAISFDFLAPFHSAAFKYVYLEMLIMFDGVSVFIKWHRKFIYIVARNFADFHIHLSA